MKNTTTYTQEELKRYIELRRELDGFGINLGLRFDLERAKQKLDSHQLGDDLKKFLNRSPQHDVDAEAWVKISEKVSETQKEIKELENKIIFNSEVSEDE